MELIPILSLIILVATISTFILAVGAYILYKVREKKGVSAQAAQPAALPAELIAPAPLVTEGRVGGERRTMDTRPGYEYQRQQQGYANEDAAKGPELRPTFVGAAPTNVEQRYERYTREDAKQHEPEQNSKRKFMRYTQEGYVEPAKTERKQEDNLRWR
ncbi:MAG: hypothetical protein KF816_10350 [Melioribacteraceae bacterium]|jgi:hypothetical protein|nr:hypothetical protein [Melioribacteraceae bacterium]